uniref:acid phosphatase n=1 Tax=Plectus sambesii TaxID=2011161 RepID=A0A914UN40_9BILA
MHRVSSLLPLLLLFLDISKSDATLTLKFVHAIWRHGDRSPSSTFPTDKGNNESTWPQGWGELTQEGMRQHYALGKLLRQRYDGFLSRAYSQYEIYVRSTSYNRTIMSAMSNMAGLYEPEGDQVWNKDIKWQPIPIHSIPREDDPMLWMDKECPNEAKMYAKVKKLPEVKKIEQEYGDLLKFLWDKTGLPGNIELDGMWRIFDPLNCEMKNEHTWPDWMNETIWADIVKLYDLSAMYYYYTEEIQRLRGGLLLGDILSRMQNRSEGTLDARQKMQIYSAHDTTLAGLLANLGALPEHAPGYAAAILVELLQSEDNHYFVEVYYRNDTNSTFSPVEVSECPRPCTLLKFGQRSRLRIPKDWYKECGLQPWYYAKPQTYLVVIGLMLAMLVVLLAIIAIYAVIQIKRRHERYIGRQLIPTDYADEDN